MLAATRIEVPRVRRGLVPRTRLVGALRDGGREARADPGGVGSGRTSLLAQWQAAERDARPFAWLSLDAADNDPVRFLEDAIAALRAVAAGSASGRSHTRLELAALSLAGRRDRHAFIASFAGDDRPPADERLVVMLRDVEGRPAGEACDALALTAAAHRVLLNRPRCRGREARRRHRAAAGAAPGAGLTRGR